eukprot:gene13857-4799_t
MTDAIDNNDGCQDTITGEGTTQDTNCTLFQPVLQSSNRVKYEKISFRVHASYSRTTGIPGVQSLFDKLFDLMKELEIGHVFAHADEQVYARLAHILWKYPEVYQKVIILMGGFHQLRSHYILGEQIPSTFAASSASSLSSENEETGQTSSSCSETATNKEKRQQ